MKALLKHHLDCMLDEDEDGNNSLHLAALNGHSKLLNFCMLTTILSNGVSEGSFAIANLF